MHEKKKHEMLWTHKKQESVFKVGEVLVTLFAAEPPIVLIYDLLVAVWRRTCPVQTIVLLSVQQRRHTAKVVRLRGGKWERQKSDNEEKAPRWNHASSYNCCVLVEETAGNLQVMPQAALANVLRWNLTCKLQCIKKKKIPSTARAWWRNTNTHFSQAASHYIYHLDSKILLGGVAVKGCS